MNLNKGEKTMKKRLIAAILAMTLPISGAAFAKDGGKTEISFKVGDSVLTVNGNPLEVTAPYVAGDGTTLVPVRVITEAFGAQVDWDGETQSVNLTYPDVNITIQINSKSAVVNNHTEELAEAPALYKDTTMVPLRFISETFGAVVTYDDDTRLITVTKSDADEDLSTVVGMTDSEYIGDSYFGWSMRNPKALTMEYRSFDGETTEFSDGTEDNYILVHAAEDDEDIDIDTEFNDAKEFMSSYTISAADKDKMSDGSTKIHFRARDKESTFDLVEYVKGKMLYSIYVCVETGGELSDEILAVNDSFEINSSREIYDLSNVNDGYREFYDEEYKVKMLVPAAWTQSEDETTNEFAFYDYKNRENHSHIGIYSKSDSVDAKSLAETDRLSNANVLNPELVTVSEVTEDGGVYSYTIKYRSKGREKQIMKDVFMEIGEYVYNISAECDDEQEVLKLINSFSAEELNPSETGTILRDSEVSSQSSVKNIANGKITVPSRWTSHGDAVMDNRTGAIITVTYLRDTQSNVKKDLENLMNGLKKDSDYEVVTNITSKTEGKNTYYSFTVKKEGDNGEVFYVTSYSARIDKYEYLYTYIRPDVCYNSGLDAEAESMIYSFEIK